MSERSSVQGTTGTPRCRSSADKVAEFGTTNGVDGGRGRRRATHPGQARVTKIFHFSEFRICGIHHASRPCQRGVRDRHETRAGWRWTRQRRRATCETGQAAVSLTRRGTTRRRNSGLVDAGGEHTQASRHSGGTVRGRRSRVVLTPGVCASSPAVMWRPDRARASVICKTTGAIVHRSPGRARRTPLKPSAQGRPGVRPTRGPPRVHSSWRTDMRVPPAPGLPCALWLPKGDEIKARLGRNAPRERRAMPLPSRCAGP